MSIDSVVKKYIEMQKRKPSTKKPSKKIIDKNGFKVLDTDGSFRYFDDLGNELNKKPKSKIFKALGRDGSFKYFDNNKEISKKEYDKKR
jgi:hypothetical protein